MIAFELAHFYGWTLDSIESMPINKLDVARDYMLQFRKSQGGENGK